MRWLPKCGVFGSIAGDKECRCACEGCHVSIRKRDSFNNRCRSEEDPKSSAVLENDQSEEEFCRISVQASELTKKVSNNSSFT